MIPFLKKNKDGKKPPKSTVPRTGDADGLFKVCGIGCGIHKGQLKVDRAVEKVEKTAPFLKNRSLILLLCQLIVDVLILDRFGVARIGHTTDAVRPHTLIRT